MEFTGLLRRGSVRDEEVGITQVRDVTGGAADLDLFVEGHAVEQVGEGAAWLGVGGEVGFYGEVEGARGGV